MKIVETFPFSEPYEIDLLLLKFQLSNGEIDTWLICENAYTFQGEYKGLLLKEILQNDTRFEKYQNKIIILEGERQFYSADKKINKENLAFECEYWQRELSREYFLQNFKDDDWIILHDVDEMIDFCENKRKSELFENLNKNKSGKLCIPRLRYWYDYDNKFDILYSSVLFSRLFLKQNPTHSFSNLRKTYQHGYMSKKWKHIIAFEYSSCFKKDHIMRKLDTFSHTGLSKDDLLRALICNHRTISGHDLQRLLRPTKRFFFETTSLTVANSPEIVRRNLHLYKTSVIDKNYKENRRIYYPHFYTFRYKVFERNFELLSNWISIQKKRIRNFFGRAYRYFK